MTFAQAAAYLIPNIGPHRNQPLACVAINHPEYIERLAREGAAECPKGGQFHQAVVLVHERLRANARASDIDGHRTVSASDARLAVKELRSDGGMLGGGKGGKAPKGRAAVVGAKANTLFE